MPEISYYPERLTAKIFDFFITQRCTMNCKLCAAAVPYIENPIHTPKETAFRELKGFFDVWDYAERVEFIGGEPLLHPELCEIVEESLRYQEKFGKLRITTNATIVPSDRLCDLAAHCGKEFDFIVDDYGIYSKNLLPLQRKLDKYQIPYRIDIYHGVEQRFGGWIYFGNYNLVNDGEGIEDRFRRCVAPKNQFVCVNDGKAFSCCYAMCLYWIHKMFPSDGSCIDLFDEKSPLQEKRSLAAGFCINPIEACRYCHGFDPERSQRYPGPPEQVPKGHV